MKRLLFIIVCCLILCSCVSCTYQTNKLPLDKESRGIQSLEKMNKALLEKIENVKRELKLEDDLIENISFLIDASWSTSGEEVIIRFLNDTRRYDGGRQIILPFTGEIYSKYAKGQSHAAEVEHLIEQINLTQQEKPNPIIRFEIKDLVITMKFADGEIIVFDLYYKELQ